MSFYKQHIIDNWGEYKCQPYIMPLAGFFGKDVNSNFQECLFFSTSSNSSLSMSPMYNISGLMGDVLGDMGGSLNSLRGGLSEIRGFFTSILGNFMDRITNLITTIQVTFIKVRSLIGKLLGIFTTLIYTLFTTIATMNSMIAGPIGTLAGLGCFDSNTIIMTSNNSLRRICEISLGDEIKLGGKVISIMSFQSNAPLFQHGDTCVSGDHLFFDDNGWRRVDTLNLKTSSNKSNMIFCLTSSTGKLVTSNKDGKEQIYADYIETSNYYLNTLIKECVLDFLNNKKLTSKYNILSKFQKRIEESASNNFYTFGFHGNTLIQLKNNSYKKISELRIGDTTKDNQVITGLIKHINTESYLYKLNEILVSGEQIIFYQGCYKLIKSINHVTKIINSDPIYQVTTQTGMITIQNFIFRDHYECTDSTLNNYIDNIVLEYLNNQIGK